MLWHKAFHIIAVVCWFAGIFYLPRIMVYYASSQHEETRRQQRQDESDPIAVIEA